MTRSLTSILSMHQGRRYPEGKISVPVQHYSQDFLSLVRPSHNSSEDALDFLPFGPSPSPPPGPTSPGYIHISLMSGLPDEVRRKNLQVLPVAVEPGPRRGRRNHTPPPPFWGLRRTGDPHPHLLSRGPLGRSELGPPFSPPESLSGV